MTLVLLDTNAYLRLAKRVRPAVGIKFGQMNYVLTIHKSVEDEVHRNPRLRANYPWFDGKEFAEERLAKQVRSAMKRRPPSKLLKACCMVGCWRTLMRIPGAGGLHPALPTAGYLRLGK